MNIHELDDQILSLYKERLKLEKNNDLLEKIMWTNDTESSTWKINYAKYKNSFNHIQPPIDHPIVVYQGEPGAYSEMAARDYFGKNVRSKGLYQFHDVFEALNNQQAYYAILPIENSSTGGIRQVYDLLALYDFYIVGETTVSVQHNLMALPGTKLEDIKCVYSHEQGLFQCEEYLNQHPEWKKVPQADTAGSAKMVSESQDRTKAAICSSLAAKIYGLDILETNINTNQNNTTRFVVISKNMELKEDNDKICISITTHHQSGSLHKVLTLFALYGLNLVRLESRPIQGRNWEYMFFIEFTGNLLDEKMDSIFLQLSKSVNNLKVFGNFKSNLKEGV